MNVCLEAKQVTIERNCNHAAKAATESVQLLGCRQVIQDTFETIHSTEEWQQAQRADTDIQPIMLWMQESPERPGWEATALYSPIT